MGKSSPQLSNKRRELKNDDNGSTKKRKKTEAAEENSSSGEMAEKRMPLSEMVSDCIHRWFEDTLKEAKSGEINMQVLVAQMYSCGYGVPQDVSKGNFWIARAARMRPSAWKVINKRYNASDSDSDKLPCNSSTDTY